MVAQLQAHTVFTDEVMELVADRFKALSEPARLTILAALGDAGELSVTALIDRTELGQANVSKHLQVLHRLGFVERRKDGLFVFYRLTGEDVFILLEMMRERLAREAGRRSQIFS